MNTNQILKQAQIKLTEHGIEEREARLLMALSLNIEIEKLPFHQEITEEENEKFQTLLDKRCSGVPFAYLKGSKEFMKLNFKVNENVLIPREDTEVLVGMVMLIIRELHVSKMEVHVLDMCTGSGCIAISLLKQSDFKNYVKMTAVDKSLDALEVAKENATLNDANVSFIESDLFANVKDKYDLIVSNPPYIKTSIIDTLQKEVKDNEPMMALDGGEDGLDFYKKIIKEAKNYLNKDGYIAFEIGFDQAKEVSDLLEQNEYKDIKVIKDFGSNDRVVIAKI